LPTGDNGKNHHCEHRHHPSSMPRAWQSCFIRHLLHSGPILSEVIKTDFAHVTGSSGQARSCCRTVSCEIATLLLRKVLRIATATCALAQVAYDRCEEIAADAWGHSVPSNHSINFIDYSNSRNLCVVRALDMMAGQRAHLILGLEPPTCRFGARLAVAVAERLSLGYLQVW
jgi:hypothetical protein